MIITTTQALADFCESAKNSKFVTIDTEFIREKTYFPQVCLVQIGTDDAAIAVDPLAVGIDLTALGKLLANPEVIKVFHAGRQDVEIFCQLFNEIPQPIFDSQIAAMVLGYGEQVGYEGLVSSILGQNLDKSQRFTDWARRPLTEKQLDYALGDVTHLRKIYIRLAEELEKTGRTEWMEKEISILTDPETYITHPENAWKRLSVRNVKPAVLARVKALAAWREETAKNKNLPRSWVISDEAITEIAAGNPKTLEDLGRLRTAAKYKANAEKLLRVLDGAESLVEEKKSGAAGREGVPKSLEPARDLLRLLLKWQCQTHKVAPKLVASGDEIDELLLGERELSCLQGWRGEVFGQKALEILEGKLAITLESGGAKARIIELG